MFEIGTLCKHQLSQANAVTQRCSTACINAAQRTVQCIHAAQSKHYDNLLCEEAIDEEPIAFTSVFFCCLILLISVRGP